MTEQIAATQASGVRPDLFLLGEEPIEINVPECETERRICEALHAMEVDWGRARLTTGRSERYLPAAAPTCVGAGTVTSSGPPVPHSRCLGAVGDGRSS